MIFNKIYLASFCSKNNDEKRLLLKLKGLNNFVYHSSSLFKTVFQIKFSKLSQTNVNGCSHY